MTIRRPKIFGCLPSERFERRLHGMNDLNGETADNLGPPTRNGPHAQLKLSRPYLPVRSNRRFNSISCFPSLRFFFFMPREIMGCVFGELPRDIGHSHCNGHPVRKFIHDALPK